MDKKVMFTMRIGIVLDTIKKFGLSDYDRGRYDGMVEMALTLDIITDDEAEKLTALLKEEKK